MGEWNCGVDKLDRKGTQKKVLVADDQRGIREVLKAVLENEGFEVILAASGREALAKGKEARPDLLVLDFLLPDLNGLEVLEEMEKQGYGGPTLFITAAEKEQLRKQVEERRKIVFLFKPFELDDFKFAVCSALHLSFFSACNFI